MQRLRTLLLGSLMFLGLIGVLSLFLALSVTETEAAAGTTRYVALRGNCGSATPCYASIQLALNQAIAGDQIKIATGVYTSTASPVFTVTKAVSLVGGYSTSDWTRSDPAARPTIIDGLSNPGAGVVRVQGTGASTATLRGLTIQNGYASNPSTGGAIYVQTSRLAVENSFLISNTAASGGAIYANSSTVRCTDVKMRNNVATSRGGAVYGTGAALYIDQSTLEGNRVSGTVGRGGALSVEGGSANLTGNSIRDNAASRGGGIYADSANLTTQSNSIVGNTATFDGGGLYIYLFGQVANGRDDIIAGNASNSGVFLEVGALTARDWTLADNGSYAIFNQGGTPTNLTNMIVSTHTNAFFGPVTADYILFNASGATPCASGTCNHVFNGDPHFMSPAHGDYHLDVGSAAVDRGLLVSAVDVDGEPRPMGSGADLGADEMPVVGPADFELAGMLWAGRGIDFTNTTTSTGKISCLWDFGDGTTATGLTVTHVYTAAGEYSVLLSATSGPFVKTKHEDVRIDEAAFISNNPRWWHETSVFTNKTDAEGTPSYLWDFGNGATSNESDPSYVYPMHGIYTVTLTASNTHGSGVASERVVIFGPPVTDFDSSDPDWLGQSTVFSDTTTGEGPLTYEWDFGDGSPLSSEISPTHQYAAAGAYSVTLTVTNRWPTVMTKTVTVYSPPAVVDFTGDPVSGVRPLTVTFQSMVETTPPGDPSLTYLWDFGDGATSTEANPQHTYTPFGAYTVTMTATNPVGSAAVTRTHYIEALPIPVDASFTANPDVGKVPLNVTFINTTLGDYQETQWDFSDGITSTLVNPLHIFTKRGVYTVTLTVSGAGGTDVISGTILAKPGNLYIPGIMGRP